jgi:hypothetical protein
VATPAQLGTHIQLIEVLAIVIARRSGESALIGRLFEQFAKVVLASREDVLDVAWGEQCIRRIAGVLAEKG